MSDKTIQNTTVGTVQPGALTAIARKEDFLQHLQDFLNTHKTEKWCVAAIDVEHFRLYNELYGTEQGNNPAEHPGQPSAGLSKDLRLPCGLLGQR